MNFKWFECILLFAVSLQLCNADKCDCDGFFCVSDTEFQLCVNGEIVGDRIPCITGAVCGNDTETHCSPQLLCQEKNACAAEGIFPDKNSKFRYFTCTLNSNTSEWDMREYICPEGTYFLEEINSCGAEEVYSTTFLCPGPGHFPDPENCQKYFQCDDRSNAFIRNCPETTYFDVDKNTCVSDIPERCLELQPSTTETFCRGSENDDMSTIKPCTAQPGNDEMSTDKSGDIPSAVQPSNSQTENDEIFIFHPTVNPNTVADTTDEQHTTQHIANNWEDKTTSTVKTDTNENSDLVITTTKSIPKYDGFVCPGEGFYPDPEYCNRYIVCNNMGIAIQILCPENSYYDVDVQGCTSDVPERCLSLPTHSNFVCTVEGLFPDPENCQRYYVCNGNSFATSVSCPEYHYYDEENMLCSLNKPERCTSSDKPSNDYTSTIPPATIHPTDTKETTTVASNMEEQVTTSSSPEEDEFQCPGEGYFPHAKDCQRYFVCTRFEGLYILEVITCTENKNFDTETKSCTDEIPERCQFGMTTPIDDGERKTTLIPTTSEFVTDFPPTSVTTSKGDEVNIIKFVCYSEGYHLDPEDCHRYYVCTQGIATSITCPENTFFNDTDKMCTYELPERCQSTTATPRYPEESTIPARETGFICFADGYYPNPEDCQSYFICHGSRFGMKISCPDKTYYNDESTYCSEERPERCRPIDEPPQNDIPALRPPIQEFICPRKGYFADPRNCRKYYICLSNNNFSVSVSCPENTFYDSDSTLCTPNMPERCLANSPSDHISTTPVPKEEEFNCPGKGYFPDPTNCQRYFLCFEFGLSITFTCPVDTYFDEEYAFCSSKMPARCKEESTEPPEENVTEEFVCENVGLFPDEEDCQKYWVCFGKNLGYHVECPKGTYYHQDSFFCLKQVPERCKQLEGFKCPGEGFFPDPADCNLYHVCYPWGIDLAARCPENTYYNDETNNCDFEMPQRCKKSETFVCPKAGLYPNPADCSSYFFCDSWGHQIFVKCPENQYFDEKIRKCSYNMPDKCRKVGTTTETPSTSSEEFTCFKRGNFPIEDDCYRYYYCPRAGSEAIISSCPKNHFFNLSKGRCRKIRRGDECSRQMEDID